MKQLNAADLRSDDYHEFMRGNWDARHSTPEARARYGVWRWRGMYEYRDVLVPELEAAETIVDFGGALGPLGFGSGVVDKESATIFGEPTIALPKTAAIVFTSHTLEHVEDYESTLSELLDAVQPGGLFIAHVPHVSSEWWWPENKQGHLRTFGCWGGENHFQGGFTDTQLIADDVTDLCGTVEDYPMSVEINRRCGDGSMLVVARKL